MLLESAGWKKSPKGILLIRTEMLAKWLIATSRPPAPLTPKLLHRALCFSASPPFSESQHTDLSNARRCTCVHVGADRWQEGGETCGWSRQRSHPQPSRSTLWQMPLILSAGRLPPSRSLKHVAG